MSENRGGWLDSEYDHGRGVASRVGPPAIGLITVAMLGLVGNCGSVFALNSFNRNRPKAPPPPNMSPDERKAFQRGQTAAPLFNLCLVGIPTIAFYGLVAAGGAAMQNHRARGLSMTAAVLAMLPCGPAFLVGLPVGIWALVILSKPDVADLFARGGRPAGGG